MPRRSLILVTGLAALAAAAIGVVAGAGAARPTAARSSPATSSPATAPAARTTATPVAPASVTLVVTASDGAGHPSGTHLRCRGASASATGYLRPRPAAACASARRLAVFLSSPPPPQRVCAQIYGGPQTAWVRGRVGTRVVDRRFARRNGCETADWSRAEALLPRIAGAPGPA